MACDRVKLTEALRGNCCPYLPQYLTKAMFEGLCHRIAPGGNCCMCLADKNSDEILNSGKCDETIIKIFATKVRFLHRIILILPICVTNG